MYARPRCRRRGIRWESGTVPQRCWSGLGRPDNGPGTPPVKSEDLPTVRPHRRVRTCRYVRAPRVGPVDAARRAAHPDRHGAPHARVRPSRPSPPGPRRARESTHVTIAPTEPASDAEVVPPAVATPAGTADGGPGQDGPGVALLRTLTELTADLPATDPGRVAAAALRGRQRGSDEAELRSLATEAAAGLICEEPAVLPARRAAAHARHRGGGGRTGGGRPSPPPSRSVTARG